MRFTPSLLAAGFVSTLVLIALVTRPEPTVVIIDISPPAADAAGPSAPPKETIGGGVQLSASKAETTPVLSPAPAQGVVAKPKAVVSSVREVVHQQLLEQKWEVDRRAEQEEKATTEDVRDKWESTQCQEYAAHPRFSASVCWSEEGCQGKLVLRGRQCALPFPDSVSREGGTHPLIHALGPDSFRIRLESPGEVLMVNMTHSGNCVYQGWFHATFPGSFVFQAFTMFEGFHGHADYPFAKPKYAPLPVVPPAVALKCVTPHVRALEGSAVEALPLCETLEEKGRWIRNPPGSPKHKELPIGDWPSKWVSAGVRFASVWGANMHWQPYRCRYRRFTQAQLQRYFQGKRIALIGDSQTRSLFYPLVNALHFNLTQGNKKVQDQNPDANGYITFTPGGVVLRYYLDNFLATEPTRHSPAWVPFIRAPTKQWDIVVVGTGNWAMCSSVPGVGLWSLERYHKEIDRIGAELVAYRQRTGTRVVWHLQPAFPWAVDYYRNNARMRLFNDYSRRAMRKRNIEVFDLFQVSDPMLHTAVGYPAGHFNDYHVRDNWARLLFSYLADH